LPAGTGRLGRFDAKGRALTVTWSTPDAPPDVFAIDTRTGLTRRLRNEARPSLATLPTVRTSSDSVRTVDGASRAVRLYLPDGYRAPAVVVQPRAAGAPSATAGGFHDLARFYAALGYAVVETDLPGDASPSARDELGGWVRAQPWLSEDRPAPLFAVDAAGEPGARDARIAELVSAAEILEGRLAKAGE
jgi:dipeptidyl aminopeptidase/acylaminoacyl peptidase